ncbi:hypothetical protein BH09DEP1_BH09DEP1_7250 [soil metagenome]
MKYLLNLFLLACALSGNNALPMQQPLSTQSEPEDTLQSIQRELFGTLMRQGPPPLVPLSSDFMMENINHVLKAMHEVVGYKGPALEGQFNCLKKLSDLGLSNEMIPTNIVETRVQMGSLIKSFADYMVIQELAIRKIEEKYKKTVEEKRLN